MEVDQNRSEILTNALVSLICTLNAQNLDFSSSESFFKGIGGEIKNSLEKSEPPLFNQMKLDQEQLSKVEDVADQIAADYKKRAEMNSSCLDVTVDSFFWSERVKQLEPKANSIYNPQREQLEEWKKVSVPDLLAATQDLLIPEKASSYKQRVSTKSNISNFRMNEGPKDRGGRTDEIIAPVRESFSEQQRSRGRGRGNRGGGHRNRPY